MSAGATSKRLVIDFSLPGQAGTEAVQQDHPRLRQWRVDVAVPGFGDRSCRPDAGRPRGRGEPAPSRPLSRPSPACASSTKRPAATRSFAPRTIGPRSRWSSTRRRTTSRSSCRPSRCGTPRPRRLPAGWTVGVTGEDALAVGRLRAVAAATASCSRHCSAGSVRCWSSPSSSRRSWRCLPLIVAAASILLTFVFLLPLTYATGHVVHRPVPGLPDRPRRRDRLLAAAGHPMAGGTRLTAATTTTPSWWPWRPPGGQSCSAG